MPDVILVGHSLGGAVVTDVAKGGALGKAVQGYAVLDVVEGSTYTHQTDTSLLLLPHTSPLHPLKRHG